MPSPIKFEEVLNKDGELIFTNVGYSMYPLIRQREDILRIVKTDTYKKGDIVFNDKEFDEFGWSIGQRVKAGVLRCGSVGFRVDELEFLEAKDRDCDLIYRKQELLEFSICCVPANPFAVHVPEKSLKIERVIQEDDSSFFERLSKGLARA